jgi:hypothetical protein
MVNQRIDLKQYVLGMFGSQPMVALLKFWNARVAVAVAWLASKILASPAYSSAVVHFLANPG